MNIVQNIHAKIKRRIRKTDLGTQVEISSLLTDLMDPHMRYTTRISTITKLGRILDREGVLKY